MLIDLVLHLSPGTKLTTTREFERETGFRLDRGSILQAARVITEACLRNEDAWLSPDKKAVMIFGGGSTYWLAFTLS